MYNSIILNIKKDRYNKYSEAFNFFQSKSINMIIGSRKLDYVVHYRDLQFYDDYTEYYKRYYGTAQTSTRIKKLINYYEINMTPPIPNLLTIHNYHILETRNRKLLKLCVMREKSLAKRSIVNQSNEQSSQQGHMILSQLNNSNQQEPSSQKSQSSNNSSYDSQPHYTYQDNGLSYQQKSRPSSQFNIHQYPDFLILEFKIPEEAPKINIIAPIINPPPPQKIMNSVYVQTLPLEISPPSKKIEKEKQKEQRQKQKPKQAEIRKQIVLSPLSEGLAIKSEIKSGNIILTESIDMNPGAKQEKKKPSFMQYYNSIPNKNPTNILQRYVKRKK